MSDAMLKLCSAQAEYELHPDESGKIPANEDGEQVGTGSTWWHKGKMS